MGAGPGQDVRPLLAFPYMVRSGLAFALPGRSANRFAIHTRQALRPGRGEGIREAAVAFNRERDPAPDGAPAELRGDSPR